MDIFLLKMFFRITANIISQNSRSSENLWSHLTSYLWVSGFFIVMIENSFVNFNLLRKNVFQNCKVIRLSIYENNQLALFYTFWMYCSEIGTKFQGKTFNLQEWWQQNLMKTFVFETETPAKEFCEFYEFFLSSVIARHLRVTVALLRKRCTRCFPKKFLALPESSFSPQDGFISECLFTTILLGSPCLKVRSASVATFKISSAISPHFIWISKQK